MEKQDQKIKNLKQMEDFTLKIYQLAIQLGISNKLAQGFKEKLSAFKPIYHKQ